MENNLLATLIDGDKQLSSESYQENTVFQTEIIDEGDHTSLVNKSVSISYEYLFFTIMNHR